MTTLLGIDPGSEGTGFALIEDGELRYVHSHAFDQTARLVTEKYKARYRAFHRQLDDIFQFVCSSRLDRVVSEWTDWHQNLKGADWKVKYHQERAAQASLWFFDTAAMAWCENNRVEFQLLGVTEWHSELGYRRKDAIAEQVARMYPDFFQLSDNHEALLRETGEIAPTHITDAVGIAHVAYSHLNLEERSTR